MNYKFPIITHIDEVKPLIDNNPSFIIAERDDYTVVNYVVASTETFPPVTSVAHAILRELRGIKFDKEGYIIARPYHKFFNVSEREETHFSLIDLSAPHAILEKLDGSMVHPIFLNNSPRPRWATKMGITDTSMQVERWIASDAKRSTYDDFCVAMNQLGLTPIFEWCSNKNRIVISYPEDKLILTAVRNMITGAYYLIEPSPYQDRPIHSLIGRYNIPTVQAFPSTLPIDELISTVRAQEGAEGVIIRFANGHMIKIKADTYVTLHRAKDAIRFEKDVAQLILTDKIDDLLPILIDEDRARVEKYRAKINGKVIQLATEARVIFNHFEGTPTRKDFALAVQACTPPAHLELFFKPLMFKMEDLRVTYGDELLTIEDIISIIVQQLLKYCTSATKYESLRPVFEVTEEQWLSGNL